MRNITAYYVTLKVFEKFPVPCVERVNVREDALRLPGYYASELEAQKVLVERLSSSIEYYTEFTKQVRLEFNAQSEIYNQMQDRTAEKVPV